MTLLKQLDIEYKLFNSVDYNEQKKSIFWDILGDFNADQITEAVDQIVEYLEYEEEPTKERLEDQVSEMADSMIDIYNGDLIDWLGHDNNYMWVDDAISEFGADERGLIGLIQMGQYKMWSDLLYRIINGLSEPEETE